MIEIVDLRSCPETIPVVAKWCADEWKYFPLEDEARRLEECLGDSAVPFTLVALDGDRPVGTIGLIEHDMETRMDLSPWLASLFVLPSHRGQGIAKRLISALIERQIEHGISPLYLFTTQQQVLYGRFGFKEKELFDYCGEQVTIMQRRLS